MHWRTCTGVDVQCGPETVIAARWGDGVHTAMKPVAGETLERDAAVVRRRRDGHYSVVDAVWRTAVDGCTVKQRILTRVAAAFLHVINVIQPRDLVV